MPGTTAEIEIPAAVRPATERPIPSGYASPYAHLPERTAAELFIATHDERYVPVPVSAALLDQIEREVLPEHGVPVCAEDAAEAVLATAHRPRPRSLYARTINPVLALADLSPHRRLNYGTWIGAATVAVWAALAGWSATH